MYGLTDPDILQLLHYKRAQGKQITIRSDRRGSPKLKKNVHVELYRGPGLMHRKLLIIDEKMVFIGSANCTTTSLKSHDNLVLGIEDRALASFCQRNSPPWVYSVPSLRVWKLPEGGKEALQSSYALIHSAQNTIRVAMFTFTHMGLANALVAAKQRGVKVEVALDHYTKNGSSKKVAAFLAGHGIPIYESRGWQLLHHKWAVIDEKVLIGGSANWTESAFKKNKELLFILPLSKELRYEMRNVWQEIRLTGNAA
jgi:phosphatidylserine/phosphatidylglycerophosphate/cardiolipin synthase-like enzyme